MSPGDRDREHRFCLVPLGIGHDVTCSLQIVPARPVEPAGVPMPVADVVDREASEEKVEMRLLVVGVRSETGR